MEKRTAISNKMFEEEIIKVLQKLGVNVSNLYDEDGELLDDARFKIGMDAIVEAIGNGGGSGGGDKIKFVNFTDGGPGTPICDTSIAQIKAYFDSGMIVFGKNEMGVLYPLIYCNKVSSETLVAFGAAAADGGTADSISGMSIFGTNDGITDTWTGKEVLVEELPDHDSLMAGKVLSIDGEGDLTWINQGGSGDSKVLVVTGTLNGSPKIGGSLTNVSHTYEQIRQAYNEGKIVVFEGDDPDSDNRIHFVAPLTYHYYRESYPQSALAKFFWSHYSSNLIINIYPNSSENKWEREYENEVPDYDVEDVDKVLTVHNRGSASVPDLSIRWKSVQSGGAENFVINTDFYSLPGTTPTAITLDKTLTEIQAAIEANKNVILKARTTLEEYQDGYVVANLVRHHLTSNPACTFYARCGEEGEYEFIFEVTSSGATARRLEQSEIVINKFINDGSSITATYTPKQIYDFSQEGTKFIFGYYSEFESGSFTMNTFFKLESAKESSSGYRVIFSQPDPEGMASVTGRQENVSATPTWSVDYVEYRTVPELSMDEEGYVLTAYKEDDETILYDWLPASGGSNFIIEAIDYYSRISEGETINITLNKTYSQIMEAINENKNVILVQNLVLDVLRNSYSYLVRQGVSSYPTCEFYSKFVDDNGNIYELIYRISSSSATLTRLVNSTTSLLVVGTCAINSDTRKITSVSLPVDKVGAVCKAALTGKPVSVKLNHDFGFLVASFKNYINNTGLAETYFYLEDPWYGSNYTLMAKYDENISEGQWYFYNLT